MRKESSYLVQIPFPSEFLQGQYSQGWGWGGWIQHATRDMWKDAKYGDILSRMSAEEHPFDQACEIIGMNLSMENG